MSSVRPCGCRRCGRPAESHRATDEPIVASPSELESIRLQLATIERLLAQIFGSAYCFEPNCLKIRATVADLIERHFEGIAEQWQIAVDTIFGRSEPVLPRHGPRDDLRNALVRLVAHLRDPNDLTTYVHLRKHCQQGMLSRAAPSWFNTVNIALKQIILRHVRAEMRGGRAEREMARDVVVAAIDERRLMVSQFYIESREHDLRASEEKYRNSINHAPDPMFEIDPETFVITGLNSAAERLHRLVPSDGAEGNDLVGKRLEMLEPPQNRAEVLMHLKQVVEHGAHQGFDVPVGPLFYDVSSALIPYGDKQFIQMILHDVTHRREMMTQLLKAERLAATGTFAAGVAHEVNNPLASISSLVQSLLSAEQDRSRRTTLHTILSQISRISGTLKDLVNFSRPSAAEPKRVDLNHLVDETLRLVSYNKRFNGVKLEPVLAPDLRPAFVDENGIQQVLLNLLFNAADATHGNRSFVRVATRNQPAEDSSSRSRVVMEVIDNGIGIPRDHLGRVFDPFFTTKPAGAGVGLGLSLCQRIVLGNQGMIRIDSEVGKGTTVTLGLPVWEGDTQSPRASLE